MIEQDTSFEALPLAAPIQRALSEKGYTSPTPIQMQAIPPVLEGRDLLGSAQTGTGKTAAFSLPILHRLSEQYEPLKPHCMRALILTPTRELAVQVADSFKAYGRHLKLSCSLVYGGVSMSPQIKAMRRGVDILVATPGRLLDLRNQGFVDFRNVECFVLDEADRMLDMGFINDIRKIVAEIPTQRQTLFFSATFAPAIEKLSHELLRDPAEVRIAPKTRTADNIDHRVCFVKHEDKPSLLSTMLEEQRDNNGGSLTLVFSRTKHGSERLAKTLNKQGIRADAIHGNKSQAARQKALDNFRKGKSKVLVATDVAARGIDVPSISLVINYDLPDEPEAYVHRIGRTARAGKQGQARSFCTAENFKELHAIERLLGNSIAMEEQHCFHCVKTASRRKAVSANKKQHGHFKKQGNRKQDWTHKRRFKARKPQHAQAK